MASKSAGESKGITKILYLDFDLCLDHISVPQESFPGKEVLWYLKQKPNGPKIVGVVKSEEEYKAAVVKNAAKGKNSGPLTKSVGGEELRVQILKSKGLDVASDEAYWAKAVAFLQELKSLDVTIYILTANNSENVKFVLDKYDGSKYVQRVISIADGDFADKPSAIPEEYSDKDSYRVVFADDSSSQIDRMERGAAFVDSIKVENIGLLNQDDKIKEIIDSLQLPDQMAENRVGTGLVGKVPHKKGKGRRLYIELSRLKF